MSLELSLALCFNAFLLCCLALVLGELHKTVKNHRRNAYHERRREEEISREIKKIIEDVQEKADDLARAAKEERAARAFKAVKK